jgi:hypothetical protein
MRWVLPFALVAGCSIQASIARDFTVSELDAGVLAADHVIPGLNSAVVLVDPVPGAVDYRAWPIATSRVEFVEGGERVVGPVTYCAGFRQRATKAGPRETATRIEVANLAEPTEYMIEALDRPCPFPGALGWSEGEDESEISGVPASPFATPGTIRDRYGSLIVNGHGPGPSRGLPADPSAPRVLARSRVLATPLSGAAAEARRTATFFADFQTDELPTQVPGGDVADAFHLPAGFGYVTMITETAALGFYGPNTDLFRDNQAFVQNGQLHLGATSANDGTGAVLVVPKTIAHLPTATDRYLHITFETRGTSMDRRFWWLSVCGAEQVGSTLDASGRLVGFIAPSLGLLGEANPSTEAWNCFIVAAKDGRNTAWPPGSTAPNPETSMTFVVYPAGGGPASNVSPDLNGGDATWLRQRRNGASTELSIADDVQDIAPKARFDLYLSRSRAILAVEGTTRACSNFGPSQLTMAEAAVGFNSMQDGPQVQNGLLTDARSGLTYYLENTPLIDDRTWDNIGFEEDVAGPADLVPSDCFTPG